MILSGEFFFLTLASIPELVVEIRASFMSLGHPLNEIRASSNETKVEIRASLYEKSPPRLALSGRLHKKFYGLDKDTHQITKPCKYHPLKTCNNDGITLEKFLASEASAMLGCPKLEFRAPVGALHDDVIKWKHFPRNWPFVRRIHRSPVNSPHKGQWRGALIFSLVCTWINSWVNNAEAGDLRRIQAHCDVSVMVILSWVLPLNHTTEQKTISIMVFYTNSNQIKITWYDFVIS